MKSVLRRLDSTHERLLAAITPLSEETFTRRPAENMWSVAEIVHHLFLVEERVIKDLEQALQKEPRSPAFVKRLIPPSIVGSRLIRVQAPKAVVPTNPPEKTTTISNYNSARNKLKELCERHGKDRLKKTTFRHPFLGEISGVTTISFIGYHELRHYKQIKDVLATVGQEVSTMTR